MYIKAGNKIFFMQSCEFIKSANKSTFHINFNRDLASQHTTEQIPIEKYPEYMEELLTSITDSETNYFEVE